MVLEQFQLYVKELSNWNNEYRFYSRLKYASFNYMLKNWVTETARSTLYVRTYRQRFNYMLKNWVTETDIYFSIQQK